MNEERLNAKIDKIFIEGLTRLYEAQGREIPGWDCWEQAYYQVAVWNNDAWLMRLMRPPKFIENKNFWICENE